MNQKEKNALIKLPYEKKAEKIAGMSPDGLRSMVERSEKKDWEGYAKLALEWGVFSPISYARPEIEIKDGPSALKALLETEQRPEDVLSLGYYKACETGEGDEWIESFARWAPKELGQKVMGEWLANECWGFASRGAGANLGIKLIEVGAPVNEDYAALAIDAARPDLLGAMLARGLNPNAKPKEGAPLLIRALHKDRMVASSLKMRCAEQLWRSGADTNRWFKGDEAPSCVLELDEMASEVQGLGEGHWGLGFELNWNYFEESGLAPEDLVPSRLHAKARARLAKRLESDDWLARCESYPWLKAALELCAMDMIGGASPKARKVPL